MPDAESTTRCPTCGSDGVTACVGLDGADHPGRPPFFDRQATAALESMARAARVTAPTLVEFLLARIAEDEAAAKAATEEGAYSWMGSAADEVLEMAQNEGCAGIGIAHFARHDPARVLARCAADRAIVEACVEDLEARDGGLEGRIGRATWDVLAALAVPHSDHPDYQEAWRP